MTLQEQYTEETNREVTEIIDGFKCYTDDYVDWLENRMLNH